MGSAVVKPLTRRRGKIKSNDQVAHGRGGNKEEDLCSCEPQVDYKVDSLADPVSNLCKPVNVKSFDVDAEQTQPSPVAGGRFERSGPAPYDSDEEPHPIQLARIECSRTKAVLEKADRKKVRTLPGNKQSNDSSTHGNAKQVSHVPHKPLTDRYHPPSSSDNYSFRRITALFQINGNSSWRSFRRKHQKESPPGDGLVQNPSNSETSIPQISEEPVQVNIEEKDVCCDARTPSPEYDELEDLAIVNPSPKGVDQHAQFHFLHTTSSHTQEASSATDAERICRIGVSISTTDQPAPEKAGEQRSEVGHVIFITPSPSREHTCDCQADRVFPIKLHSLDNIVADHESGKSLSSPRPEEICCINVPDTLNNARHEIPNEHVFKDQEQSASNSDESCHDENEEVNLYEDKNEDSFEPFEETLDYDTPRRYSSLSMSAFTSLWPQENIGATMPTLPEVEEIAEHEGNCNEDQDEQNSFTRKATEWEMQRTAQHVVIEVVAHDNNDQKDNKSERSSRSSSAHSNNSSLQDIKQSQVSFTGRTSIRNSPQEMGATVQAASSSESTNSRRNFNSDLQAASHSESTNSLSISTSNLLVAKPSGSKTSLQRFPSHVQEVQQSASKTSLRASKTSLRNNHSNLHSITPSHSRNSLQRCTSNLQSLSRSASKSSLKNSNCDIHMVTSSDSKHSHQSSASDVQVVALSESKISIRNNDEFCQAVAPNGSQHSLKSCRSNVQAGTQFSRPTSGHTCLTNTQVSEHDLEIVKILQEQPSSISPRGDTSSRNSDLEQNLSDSHHQQNTPTPCPSLTNVRQSPSQKSVGVQEEDKVKSKQSLLKLDDSFISDIIRGKPTSEKLYTPLGNANVLKSRPISASELNPLSNFLPHQNGPTKLPPINGAVTKVNRPSSAKQSVSRSEEFLPSSRPSSGKLSESRPQSGYSRASSNHSRPVSAIGSSVLSNLYAGQWENNRRSMDTRVDMAEPHHGEGEQIASKNDNIKDVEAATLDPYTEDRTGLGSTIYHETIVQKTTEASCEGGDGHYLSSLERCCIPTMLAPCIGKTPVAASRSGDMIKPTIHPSRNGEMVKLSILPCRSGEMVNPSILPRLSSSATKEDVDSSSPPERPNSSRGPGSVRVSWSGSPTGDLANIIDAYNHQALSLSHDQIGSIRQQLYEEGLKPAERDGGVAFFIPMTIDGLQPQANGGTISDRLTRSRKCSLNYEERLLLANINRQVQLHKRKEFAVKDIQNVKGATSGSDTSDRTKQEDDFDIDWDGAF